MTSVPVGQWGPRTSLDRVYTALEDGGHRPTKRSMDFFALCPVHEESSGSLHVTYKAGSNGRVVLTCFGCHAEAATIVGNLGLTMADLFDNPPPERTDNDRRTTTRLPRTARPGPLPKPLVAREPSEPACEHVWQRTHTYDYVDAHGEQLQQVVRMRCETCGGKEFRQAFAVDGDLVHQKPSGFTPVLYRLPELRQAIATGVPVWLMEGEKDVETAEDLGLVATTNAGGSGSFPEASAAIFEGADVNVVLDRDGPGWARGARLYELLTAAAATRVRLWMPALTAPKADFTDHVAADLALEDLELVAPSLATAQAALARAYDALERLEKCEPEARAHWEAATQRKSAAPKAADDHRRKAARWAQESVIRWGKLAEISEAVLGEVERAAGEKIEATARDLDAVLEQADGLVRASHDSAHQALPMHVLDQASELRARAIRPGDAGKVLDLPLEQPEESRAEKATRVRGSVTWPEYSYLDGGIVRSTWKAEGRGANSEYVLSHEPVINLSIHLDAIEVPSVEARRDSVIDELIQEYSDNPEDRVNALTAPVAHIYSWADPRDRKRVRVRVSISDAQSGDWLDQIALPGLNYARDRKGRSEVVRAIAVVSRDTRTISQHKGTGWYEHPQHGWSYAHFAGTITADGTIADPAVLTGPLTRYSLPLPTTDASELRSAFFEHSLPLMTKLHPTAGGTLLGVAYKATLERVPYSPVLVGSPGSYKTGFASLVQQHYGPAWDRNSPLASLTDSGASSLAMRLLAHEARFALGLFDDATPSGRGGYAAAQERMGSLIQGFFNQAARDVSNRDHEIVAGKEPNVTAMFTSEVPPRMGANARRAIILPVDIGEISIEDIITLDEKPSRMARARLTASLIQWAAGDLESRREWLTEQRTSYMNSLREGGATNEECDWGSHVWAGWALMTQFLRELGAIAPDEQTKILEQAHLNIHGAISAAQDPDEPLTIGTRILEALRGSLRNGDLYLTDVDTNGAPRGGLANRLGWFTAASFTGTLGGTEEVLKYSNRAVRMGYLNIDSREVLVDNRDLERAIKVATSGLAEPLILDAGTIRRALRVVDAIRTEPKPAGGVATSVKRTIKAETSTTGAIAKRRVVAIRLDALLGEEHDGDDEGPTTVPPMPWDPQLDGGSDTATTPPTPTPTVEEENVPSLTDQKVTVLATPAPCTWCGDSTKFELGGLPFHSTCWAKAAEGAPTETEDEEVTILTDLEQCIWCLQPTRYAVGGMPLHTACWTTANAEADRVTTQAASRHTEIQTPDPAPAAPATSPPIEPTPPSPATAQPKESRGRTAPASAAIAAVVADIDGVHLPDGTIQPLPEIHHLGDLAQLAQTLTIGVEQRKGYLDSGAVIVTRDLAAHLGLPVDLPEATAREPQLPQKTFEELTREHPMLLEAVAAGWMGGQHRRSEAGLQAWTVMWRDQVRTRIAFQHVMSTQGAIATPMPPATLAKRLQRFADVMGIGWHVSAQSVGLDLMEHLQYKRREELFVARSPELIVPPATLGSIEGDFDWSRPPTAQEAELGYVHLYDRGGSYLAGIAGTELPIGDPVHHPDGAAFEVKTPGYWKIRTEEAGDWRYPNPLLTGSRGNLETKWVTTPTLDLAASLGYEPEILEAYTWPAHGRVLDTWYSRMRGARNALDREDSDDDFVVTLVKEVYTRTIGQLGGSSRIGSRFYLPERRHHIIAKARANLLRAAIKIGTETDVWPLAIRTDGLLYASNEPDPAKAWPGDPTKLGRGLGQMRPERTGLMADQLPHLNRKRTSPRDVRWPTEAREEAMNPIGEIEEGSE